MTKEEQKEYYRQYRIEKEDDSLLMRYKRIRNNTKRLSMEQIVSLFKREDDAKHYLWLVKHRKL